MGMGNNIKHLRAAKGWSHDKLGGLAQTSGQTIEMLERRDSTRSKYAAAIAAAFGIPLDLLLSANLRSTAEAESLLNTPAAVAQSGQNSWPFKKARYSDYEALTAEQKRRLEEKIVDFIDGALAAKSRAS